MTNDSGSLITQEAKVPYGQRLKRMEEIRKARRKSSEANPGNGNGEAPPAESSVIIEASDTSGRSRIKEKGSPPGIIEIPWPHPNPDKLPDPPQQVTARSVKCAPRLPKKTLLDTTTHRVVIPPTPAVNHQVPGKKALTVIAVKGDSLPGDRLSELAKKLRAGLPGCGGSYIHYSGECCKSRRFENLIFLIGGQWPREMVGSMLEGITFDVFTFPNRNEIAPWVSTHLFNAICHCTT